MTRAPSPHTSRGRVVLAGQHPLEEYDWDVQSGIALMLYDDGEVVQRRHERCLLTIPQLTIHQRIERELDERLRRRGTPAQ